MNHWLLKSEPDTFSIDALGQGAQTDHRMGWRAQLSGAQHAAGLYKKRRSSVFLSLELRRARHRRHRHHREGGYPDKTAFDPKHHHYDADSKADAPRWYVVDVKLVRKFERVITLDELRKHAGQRLEGFRSAAPWESSVGDAGIEEGLGFHSHARMIRGILSDAAHIATTLVVRNATYCL
jgi:hypothetical protein